MIGPGCDEDGDDMGYQPAGRDQLAAAFGHPGVADAYQHRPPYPPEVFDILERIIAGRPRRVLDLGAGEGALARPLAGRVDRVDALDISAAMVEAGRGRPGGGRPNLRWIVGAAQTAELGGPYALVTAGASLHWMPWAPTLARLAAVMTDHAVLAIVEHGPHDLPWGAELAEIITRHSRSSRYDPSFWLPDALSAAGLLEITGQATTAPVSFRQPVKSHVEQLHSTASLAREWMSAQESAAFDQAVTDIVAPYAVGGVLEMAVVAHLAWGRPTTKT
jgi:ubiquinone/menaquinone biosynthesis C-methylase UbiE